MTTIGCFLRGTNAFAGADTCAGGCWTTSTCTGFFDSTGDGLITSNGTGEVTFTGDCSCFVFKGAS